MKKIIIQKITLFLTALFSFSISLASPKTQSVTVYTYDSFSAEWSAGPKIKADFEQQFPQCKLHYVSFENNGTLFNRVRLEGKKINADIVLGLDNHQIDAAQKLALFAPHQVNLNRLSLPIIWDNPIFLPYDFGQYAFIYNKNHLKNPPKSLKELVARQDLKILYQDPRTSSIGRGLLLWMNAVYPADEITNAWQTLAKHTVTITKGWTESYGAFLKGEGDLVLSHNTSPLYHLLAEQKDDYAAMEPSEGGILQIETAAKIAHRNNACADAFLPFLITPSAQMAIAKNNVMLPVIDTPIEPHIDVLKQRQYHMRSLNEPVTDKQLKQWINQWQQALAQ